MDAISWRRELRAVVLVAVAFAAISLALYRRSIEMPVLEDLDDQGAIELFVSSQEVDPLAALTCVPTLNATKCEFSLNLFDIPDGGARWMVTTSGNIRIVGAPKADEDDVEVLESPGQSDLKDYRKAHPIRSVISGWIEEDRAIGPVLDPRDIDAGVVEDGQYSLTIYVEFATPYFVEKNGTGLGQVPVIGSRPDFDADVRRQGDNTTLSPPAHDALIQHIIYLQGDTLFASVDPSPDEKRAYQPDGRYDYAVDPQMVTYNDRSFPAEGFHWTTEDPTGIRRSHTLGFLAAIAAGLVGSALVSAITLLARGRPQRSGP